MKRIIGANARGAPAAAPVSGEAVAARLLTVDEAGDGQRLDNFLLRRLRGVPKSHVYRIIRSGQVRVNRGRAAADTRLAEGDRVRVPPLRLPPAGELVPVPPRAFAVLYEDAALLALDKPAGVAVHGGSGVAFGVIEQLRRARPADRQLELVHRLDRETSGVLLVARRRAALTALQQQFRARAVGKTYLALVHGAWPASLKVIDRPLHRYLLASGERRVRVTDGADADGRRSVTLVRVARRLGDATLLEVTIKTGRTHQIRVHLAASGHPIVGDDKYGDAARDRPFAGQGLRRMFLHAWRLQLDHPLTGAPLRIEAPLPQDLQAFIDRESTPTV